MEVTAGLTYQDGLWQRILATIVVVDAVVRDLLTNLTSYRAQDYHCSTKAEQAQVRVIRFLPLSYPDTLSHGKYGYVDIYYFIG